MKNNVLVFMLVFTFLSCQTKEKSQLPEVVESAFLIKYPGEKATNWEKDANGYYEFHFKKEGVKYRADFSPSGHWIETETSINKKDLPKPIREAIKKNYGRLSISEIEKVDSSSKGEFYDVEFKQKGKNMDIEYRSTGEEL